jgi:DNA-directed RNA polymerase specialized sigma subunit
MSLLKENELKQTLYASLKTKSKRQILIRNLGELLTEVEAVAIYCRYWENMTIEEISSVIEHSWDATDSIINKALIRMKDALSTNSNLAHQTN